MTRLVSHDQIGCSMVLRQRSERDGATPCCDRCLLAPVANPERAAPRCGTIMAE